MFFYYLLLALNVSFAVTRSILIKNVKKAENGFRSIRFNVMLFVVAVVAMLPLVLSDIEGFSDQPLYLSAIYGVALIGSIVCSVESIACGPVSLSLLFYQSGFLIPTVFGALYFNENMSALSITGLVLVVLSLAITIDRSDKKFSVKWLSLSVSGLVFCGLLGIVQKLFGKYKTAHPAAGQIHFTFISLSFALIIALITMLVAYYFPAKANRAIDSETNNEQIERPSAKKCVFVIVIGVLLSAVNVLNTILAGKLPSVVFFPVFNVGVIVLSTIVSALLLKERPSLKQIVSIALGSFAIIIIALGQLF